MKRRAGESKKDGTKFWANVIITPIYNDESVLIGFSKITRDLTERKLAEDDLKRTNVDLDTFVYTASHDLRAPISNLEGLIYSIHQEMKPDCKEEIEVLFDMMQASIEKLRKTISELSDISRIQKDVVEDIQPVDVNELLEEFKINYREEIRKSNVHMVAELRSPFITFSKRNLRSIFENLMSNAIKFRSSERPLEIFVRTFTSDTWIILSIQDNGLGIEFSKQDKIFGMFKRLHDHVEGTGVGLYIVKRVIENSGGKVEVQSEEGKGTIFNVYFPKV